MNANGMFKRPNYESDDATFPSEAYIVQGYRGVAWRVYGWELEGVFPEYEDECWGCDGTGVQYDTEHSCNDPRHDTPCDYDKCQACQEECEKPTGRVGSDEPCPTCDGSGKLWVQSDEVEEVRTGKVVCVMVGDDRRFAFDPDDITPLDDLAYCASCGQIGCEHDGRDRT